jgi:hypothetical protein
MKNVIGENFLENRLYYLKEKKAFCGKKRRKIGHSLT